MTTMSLRLSVGARQRLTYARKVFPLIAPSTANGAVIPLRRRAATNVIVFQCPCGTRQTRRSPRGQRPLSRTILVLAAVSSMNTSRVGSSMACSRFQRRRGRRPGAPAPPRAQQPICVLLQRRRTPSARLCPGASSLAPALKPPHRRTGAEPVVFGSLTPRRPGFHGFDNTLSQVVRIRLRHRFGPPNTESMPPDSPTQRHLEIPSIQPRRNVL